MCFVTTHTGNFTYSVIGGFDTLAPFYIAGKGYSCSISDSDELQLIFYRPVTLGLALALVFMIGTAAYAAGQWGIFEFLSTMFQNQPSRADAVMQGELHKETVNGVEITVKEAGYDGKRSSCFTAIV